MARPGRQLDDLGTIEAARLLGLSRQRVADLFDEGQLAGFRVGTHRRIRRTSVEGMIAERTREVSPSEVVSLWLGRVAAGHIATDQATAFAAARRWLDEIAATRPEARIYVARWRRILDAGPEAAMRVLTASDSESSALRGMSPFVAMLSETERRQVVRAAMVAAGTRS